MNLDKPEPEYLKRHREIVERAAIDSTTPLFYYEGRQSTLVEDMKWLLDEVEILQCEDELRFEIERLKEFEIQWYESASKAFGIQRTICDDCGEWFTDSIGNVLCRRCRKKKEIRDGDQCST